MQVFAKGAGRDPSWKLPAAIGPYGATTLIVQNVARFNHLAIAPDVGACSHLPMQMDLQLQGFIYAPMWWLST